MGNHLEGMAKLLAKLESKRDQLDAEIKALRGDLMGSMKVGDHIPAAGRLLAKLDRKTWKVDPVKVYQEVGPRKFLHYVNSESVPTVRNDLGEKWMEKNADATVTEYIAWQNVPKNQEQM